MWIEGKSRDVGQDAKALDGREGLGVACRHRQRQAKNGPRADLALGWWAPPVDQKPPAGCEFCFHNVMRYQLKRRSGWSVTRAFRENPISYTLKPGQPTAFNRAAENDPGFSEPYVGLEQAYFDLSDFRMPAKQAFSEVKKSGSSNATVSG